MGIEIILFQIGIFLVGILTGAAIN